VQKKQLSIDLDALAENGRVGARRAAAFIAMGQKAWTDESIKSAAVETPFSIQLLPDPLPDELANEVRRNFRLWVIGSAISEIVQGLSHFADRLFEIAVLVPYSGKAVPQDALDHIRRCQADTNLHSKLQRTSGLGPTLTLLEHTDSWTRARNSLAHNHGIIRDRDCSPNAGVLKVSWRQVELSIDGHKIDNPVGLHVEKGDQLAISWVDGSKSFQLNDRISFSEQEIMNICLTAFAKVDNAVAELQKYIAQFIEVVPAAPKEN
jgi:hypothetical protein